MSTATSSPSLHARLTDQLERLIGKQKVAMWFDRSARIEFNQQNNSLKITVPNRFVADWIGGHFHTALQDAACNAVGQRVQVDLAVEPTLFQAPQTPQAPLATATRHATGHVRPAAHAQRSRMNWRHDLRDFIVGPSNALAFAAAERLAEDDMASNAPLFIHGGCGLGKTHLLQGLCRQFAARHPRARVLYTTGEQFTNNFITAVRENGLEPFRQRMRQLDLLAVDDIHFIASKEKTQQEFLHSFDQIELCGARVALASDSHPRLIRQLSEALISRCVRGLVVEVQAPDLETRVRLIQALAARRQMGLTPALARKVAEAHAARSVRELEGILTKCAAMARLQAGPSATSGPCVLHDAILTQVLAVESPTVSTRPVRFEAIMQTTCRLMGCEAQQVLGSGRHRHVVLVRSMVIHLAREMTSMSYPEIAHAMHRSNHSTIITAAQRMQRDLAKSPEPVAMPGQTPSLDLREWVAQLKQAILRESIDA